MVLVGEAALLCAVVGLWATLLSPTTQLLLALAGSGAALVAGAGAKWVHQNGVIALLPASTKESLLRT